MNFIESIKNYSEKLENEDFKYFFLKLGNTLNYLIKNDFVLNINNVSDLCGITLGLCCDLILKSFLKDIDYVIINNIIMINYNSLKKLCFIIKNDKSLLLLDFYILLVS